MLRKNNSVVSVVPFERKDKVGPTRAGGLPGLQSPTLSVSLLFEFNFTMRAYNLIMRNMRKRFLPLWDQKYIYMVSFLASTPFFFFFLALP